MDTETLGRLIARLAAAVIAADGRITAAELVALRRLDDLGLGSLTGLAREEIERAIHEPIDVQATCAALPPLGEGGAALLLTVLAEIAASDRLPSARERQMFGTVARQLGVGAATATGILEAAISATAGAGQAGTRPSTPPETASSSGASQQRAFCLLGLDAGAPRSRIDAAYLDLIRRYDPARVTQLGPEFAALAIRRLATVTDAYEAVLGSLENQDEVPRAGLADVAPDGGTSAVTPQLLARQVMRAVRSIAPGDSLALAARLMKAFGAREIPVVDDNTLVGILTRTDMEPYRGHFEWTAAKSAMTADPVTVLPDSPISAVMRLLLDRGFNSVPVSAGGALLGMIGRTDALRALAGVG